jgi:[protein-PII] uridylyltransferase
MQNRVRNQADRVFKKFGVRKELGTSREIDRLIGEELTSFIDPSNDEAPLNALFRSRLIDHCVPEFRKIVGHVQHDQYHRFSVDAHILQAVRELGRLKKSPKLAGKLSKQLQSLNKSEWEILSFACLYHDIAKGREGDHSVEGVLVADHDLKAFGKSESFIREVAWIVEEHLILSSASFKENPSSPRTWAKLSGKGVEKRRIPILAAFTIVDIRATNPEAWTPWKERLMNEVVTNLENPESTHAIQFAKLMGEESMWVERLDSFLVSMLPAQKLAVDLKAVIEATSKGRKQRSVEADVPMKVLKSRGGQTWIRFHAATDRAGLFAHYVGALAASGLSIRHASIHTFNETGVYDWFEVKTLKTPAVIAKLVALALTKEAPLAKKPVKFDEISLASQSNEEWVVSFRGKDQQGALLQAATALFDLKAEIQWARVHTWGRQIVDTFGIKPPKDGSAADLLSSLKSQIGSQMRPEE